MEGRSIRTKENFTKRPIHVTLKRQKDQFAWVIIFCSVYTKAQDILYHIQRAVYIVTNEIRKKANSATFNVSCCPVG
jgi:uncharacterized membrane protein